MIDETIPALPQQEEPAKCELCGDTFGDHYSLGSRKVCYNKDPQKMAIITGNYFTPCSQEHGDEDKVLSSEPIAPLLGQDEPAITDDLVESIQEVSKLRAELTQALTSLAAAREKKEEVEQLLNKRT